MTLYSYRALDEQGKTHKGLQDAANQVDLELRLKRSGLDLIDARMDTGKVGMGRGKIKRTELITFFFNLEQLSGAGVPLLESLADLRDTMDDPAFPRNHRQPGRVHRRRKETFAGDGAAPAGLRQDIHQPDLCG